MRKVKDCILAIVIFVLALDLAIQNNGIVDASAKISGGSARNWVSKNLNLQHLPHYLHSAQQIGQIYLLHSLHYDDNPYILCNLTYSHQMSGVYHGGSGKNVSPNILKLPQYLSDYQSVSDLPTSIQLYIKLLEI